jgi:hypothetical protein
MPGSNMTEEEYLQILQQQQGGGAPPQDFPGMDGQGGGGTPGMQHPADPVTDALSMLGEAYGIPYDPSMPAQVFLDQIKQMRAAQAQQAQQAQQAPQGLQGLLNN